MTPALLVRLFLVDYVRNGVNVFVLVAVPGTFVLVAANTMAEAADALGGDGVSAARVTAGWAAGFVAAVGTYFLVAGNRATDRRLVLSGLDRRAFTTARMASGLAIAAAAALISLAALAIRTGVDDTWRTSVGTLMFAVIYAAFGALVGVLLRDAVNGTVAILFTWIVDVFFGPAFTGSSPRFAQFLPTHYVSLWMTGVASGHGDRNQNPGPALVWTFASLLFAALLLRSSTRVARVRRGPSRGRRNIAFPPRSSTTAASSGSAYPIRARGQYGTALRWGVAQELRNRVLWLLLAAVPAVFVLMSAAITPARQLVLNVLDGGRTKSIVVDLSELHAGTMAPDGVAALAMLASMFVVIASARADRRLVQAGMPRSAIRLARLATILLTSLSAVTASLLVTALVFQPVNWLLYAFANVLIALTFAALGVLIGPLTGRVAGVLLAFLIPFIDLGLSQSPMLRAAPPGWAHALPGYGGMRLLIDGALTSNLNDRVALALGLAWMVALGLLAVTTIAPGPGQRSGGVR